MIQNNCRDSIREHVLQSIRTATDNQIMQMLFELYECGTTDNEEGTIDFDEALCWAGTGNLWPNNDGEYHIE